MDKLKVNVKIESYGGHSHCSEEEYGDWSEEHNLDPVGLLITNYTTADFYIEKDKRYFLVYYKYLTGNSFGHSTGNLDCTEIFYTYEEAEIFKNIIETIDNYNKNNNTIHTSLKEKDNRNRIYNDFLNKTLDEFDNYSFKYKGKTYSTSNFVGYFESLESVEIKELKLL